MADTNRNRYMPRKLLLLLFAAGFLLCAFPGVKAEAGEEAVKSGDQISDRESAQAADRTDTSDSAKILLEEEKLCINAVRISTQAGRVQLDMEMAAGQEEADILLFDPIINGELASFEDGWGLMEAVIPPSGSDPACSIGILSDDPAQEIRTVSLRFIDQGRISTLCTIDVSKAEEEILPARFLSETEEGTLVSSKAGISKRQILYRTYRDQLTAEQMALLDYGQMVVLLKDADSGLYRQAATCELETGKNGEIRASYSGLVLSADEEGSMLIETREEKGSRVLTTKDGLSLTGTEVFFARLMLTADLNEQYPTIRPQVLSDELGGSCSLVPCDLFEQAQTGTALWTLTTEGKGGESTLVRGGIVTDQMQIKGQLDFFLLPAEELGNCTICFEYYFKDGTSLLRLR